MFWAHPRQYLADKRQERMMFHCCMLNTKTSSTSLERTDTLAAKTLQSCVCHLQNKIPWDSFTTSKHLTRRCRLKTASRMPLSHGSSGQPPRGFQEKDVGCSPQPSVEAAARWKSEIVGCKFAARKTNRHCNNALGIQSPCQMMIDWDVKSTPQQGI